MENVSKFIAIGFGAIVFSVALTLCLIMYGSLSNLLSETEHQISTRRVLEVRQLE